ncbi:MAG: N-acetylmuramoyl-L-alanine amidase [Cellulosilyticum sp.]|nr:N-acetylmuramoyl-L-alanine amidase [Cellulosilyticum sp.]
MRKKISIMLLVGYLICQSRGMLQAQTLNIDGQVVAYSQAPIELYVNQKLIQTTVMDPVVIDNRVLVPSREVFEAMGAKVGWDNATKKVTIEYKNQTIILIVNDPKAFINGKVAEMDVPGKNINGKVMIPIRFVSEAMGMNVKWDSANRSVWIDEPVDGSTEVTQTPNVQNVVTSAKSTQFVASIVASSAMKDIQVFTQTDKVIIDIPNSKSLLNRTIAPVSNMYVANIRTSQFTADTTRVVLDLNTPVNVSTNYSSDCKSFHLTLTSKNGSSALPEGDTSNGSSNNDSSNNGSGNTGSESGDSNTGESNNGTSSGTTSQTMTYTAGSKPKLTLPGITTSKVKVTDDYRNKILTLDLGADYSKTIPNKVLKPNDAYVDSITVETKGTTKVKIVTNKIYTYNLTSSNNQAVFEMVRPKEKYRQIVVVDIGHGGSDSGAVGNGLREKEINFNQGMALYRLLEADSNIKVYMTRETDVYETLKFRATLANEIEADLFVSIHNNSASSTVTGTETLYYPSTTDKRGEKIAKLVQDGIIKTCGTKDRGIKPRTDLFVLNSTNMPAILIETGFISNASEAQLINNAVFIDKWAKSVYGSIVEGFKLLQR